MSKQKIKTHKAIAKRFKKTGRGKLLKRKAGQNHFNARDTGVRTMGKRSDLQLHSTLDKSVRRLTPANASKKD